MLKIKTRFAPLAVLAIMAVTFFSGCYQDRVRRAGSVPAAVEEGRDTVSLPATLHYSLNYNFVVRADSLSLLRQRPEEYLNGMTTDSVAVFRGNHLVVADICVIPADTTDSLWVKVARDQETIGWVHGSSLLTSVVPDDPISQFILIFSDIHLLIFLIVISIISVAYLMRTIFRRNAKIVHFNDIPSFYPMLLALMVAFAATLYSSIQMFAPDMWQEFYFHPTLNPFGLPAILSVFIMAVWAILVVAIAAADVVFKELPLGEAMLYMCGLAGVCAVNYIVFSITTLYFAGYVILVAYIVFALRLYFRSSYYTCLCGNCGARMRRRGRCPECGAVNE